jgi:hypothetical protein
MLNGSFHKEFEIFTTDTVIGSLGNLNGTTVLFSGQYSEEVGDKGISIFYPVKNASLSFQYSIAHVRRFISNTSTTFI